MGRGYSSLHTNSLHCKNQIFLKIMTQPTSYSRIKIPSFLASLSNHFFQLSCLPAWTCDHVFNLLCNIYNFLALYCLTRFCLITLPLDKCKLGFFLLASQLLVLCRICMYSQISTCLHACPVLPDFFLVNLLRLNPNSSTLPWHYQFYHLFS